MMFRHNRQLTWQLQISLANEKIPSGLWDASHCIPLSYVHSGSSWTCKTSTISYSGREFAPPVPLLWLIQLRDVRRRLFLKTKTKFYSVAQPSSHIFFYQFVRLAHQGRCSFLTFFLWLMYLNHSSLVFLCSENHQLQLDLPDPILMQVAASWYSSQDTCPCFHGLWNSFIPFRVRRCWLIHASLLSSFPDFLHLRGKISCTLRKDQPAVIWLSKITFRGCFLDNVM